MTRSVIHSHLKNKYSVCMCVTFCSVYFILLWVCTDCVNVCPGSRWNMPSVALLLSLLTGSLNCVVFPVWVLKMSNLAKVLCEVSSDVQWFGGWEVPDNDGMPSSVYVGYLKTINRGSCYPAPLHFFPAPLFTEIKICFFLTFSLLCVCSNLTCRVSKHRGPVC